MNYLRNVLWLASCAVLVLTAPSCAVLAPSVPVAEMTDAQFTTYVESVESTSERWTRTYLYDYPDKAEDVEKVATIVAEDLAGKGLVGDELQAFLEQRAVVEWGVSHTLVAIVAEAIESYRLKIELKGVELVPERWEAVLKAVAEGMASAADSDGLEGTSE